MITNKQRGFSLAELMVVVAIIGVLASLAVPKLKVFQAKARQTEAKNNLALIFTLEQSYYGDNDTFTSMKPVGPESCDSENDLGFKLSNCKKARYTYSVESSAAHMFVAHATSGEGASNKIIPGCATADHWSMDQDKVLKDENKAIAKCN